MSNYPFEKYFKVKSKSQHQLSGFAPHRVDKNPSFSANTATGLWFDHATGEKGNWFTFCKIVPRAKSERIESKYKYRTKDGHCRVKVRTDFITKNGVKDKKMVWNESDNSEELDLLPYNYESLDKSKQVFYVEGEKCVDLLKSIGFTNAVTCGGANNWKKSYAKYFAGAEVIIFPDNDKPGMQLASRVFEDLASIASPKIAMLPNLREGEDVADLIERHEMDFEILTKYLSDDSIVYSEMPPHPDFHLAGRLRIRKFCDITKKQMEYFDGDTKVFAKGMVIGFSGDPSAGKSRLLRKMISELSKGRDLVGKSIKPIKTLILTGEDHPEVVIKPDLDNYGADQKNVFIIEDPMVLDAKNLELIGSHIDKYGTEIIIVDTIASYMDGGADLNSTNSVKNYFKPILDFAKKKNICFCFIRHLNKNSSQGSVLYRGAGSIAITGTFRSEFHVFKKNIEPFNRSLIHVKCNFAKNDLHINFDFNANGTVNIGSIKHEENIDQVYKDCTGIDLVKKGDSKPSKLDEIKNAIYRILSHKKEIDSSELSMILKSNGFSKASIDRAKSELTDSIQKKDAKGRTVLWKVKLKENFDDDFLNEEEELDDYPEDTASTNDLTEEEQKVMSAMVKNGEIKLKTCLSTLSEFGFDRKRSEILIDLYYERRLNDDHMLLVPRSKLTGVPHA